MKSSLSFTLLPKSSEIITVLGINKRVKPTRLHKHSGNSVNFVLILRLSGSVQEMWGFFSGREDQHKGMTRLQNKVRSTWHSRLPQSGLQAPPLSVFLAALSVYISLLRVPCLQTFAPAGSSAWNVPFLPHLLEFTEGRHHIFISISFVFCIICGSYILGIENV